MVDAMRQMLDELMGEDRNGDRVKVQRKFSDPDVCKMYLCGFCVKDEYQRTKHDYGICELVHDDEARAQWQALDDKQKEKYGYEKELKQWIDKLMSDLRAKVRRNEERLKETANPILPASEQAKVAELDNQIKALVETSERLGESGDVDAAQAAATQAERLKVQRSTMEEEAKQRIADGINRYGHQEVCPFSGVIINSEESRMRDHKNGRNYKAWVRVHEVQKELEATFKRRAEEAGGGRDRDRKAASRDRDRERDRDRDRDRARDRDRERGRGGERSGDRDRRERDRQYDGSRRGDRERGSRSAKHRSRSRSQGRDRDRDRRREAEVLPPPPPRP